MTPAQLRAGDATTAALFAAPITATIDQIDIGPSRWCVRHTRQHFWPSTPHGAGYRDAVVWIVVLLGDAWFAVAVDSLRAGNVCCVLDVQDPWLAWTTIAPETIFPHEIRDQVVAGAHVGVIVSSTPNVALSSGAEFAERSALVLVEWPDKVDAGVMWIVARESELIEAAAPARDVERIEPGDVGPLPVRYTAPSPVEETIAQADTMPLSAILTSGERQLLTDVAGTLNEAAKLLGNASAVMLKILATPAPDDAGATVSEFNQHCETCATCREHPFNLCDVGAHLLAVAANHETS